MTNLVELKEGWTKRVTVLPSDCDCNIDSSFIPTSTDGPASVNCTILFEENCTRNFHEHRAEVVRNDSANKQGVKTTVSQIIRYFL